MKTKIAALLSTLVVASTLTVPSVSAAQLDSQAEVEFTPGQLSITSAESFLFEKQTVSSGIMSVPNQVDFSVALEDETGTGSGWHLKAALSDFALTGTDPAVSGNVLAGASLKLDGGTANSTLTDGTVTGANTEPAIELTSGALDGSVVASSNANEDLSQAGVGPWTLDWKAANTTLNIPAATAFSTADGEKVVGTVTWTLATGPSGDTTVQ